MATKTFCDRCKKESPIHVVVIRLEDFRLRYADLCQECISAFTAWFECESPKEVTNDPR